MNTKLNHVQDWLKLAKQANWSVSNLAKICGVSPRTLERFFIKKTGKAPKIWLIEYRRKQAEKLLSNGSSVKETAALLGYSYLSHFSKEFKKNYGYCPTKFCQNTHSKSKCRIFA